MEIMSTAEAKKQIGAKKARGAMALGLMAMGASVGYALAAQAAFADQATDLVNQAGSGGISTAKTLMDGPAGTIIYLVVGFSILAMVVGIILWVVNKGKKG